jgi:hypothetical protein
MSCPYLATVTMVYCKASSQRVYVPSDKVTTAGRCEGDCFSGCPMYRDAEQAAGQEIADYDAEPFRPPVELTVGRHPTPQQKGAGRR